MTPLRSPTSPRWLAVALADFDRVLCDHAHCEKKAAATALALLSDYADRDELVRRMARLAAEELRHFQAVHRLIVERGLTLERDKGDPYARELARLARHGADERRTDRLLIAALIEARSAERLDLLAGALPDPSLRAFYAQLATAEAGHHALFVDLAERYADPATVQTRLIELATAESEILAALPVVARVH